MVTKAEMLDDVRWIIEHPEFEERPPSISQFLGPDYLDIEKRVRRRIKAELVEIFGEEFRPGQIARYSEVLVTGGIGIGKTLIASIVLSYMACCTLCLVDPQDYYHLIKGSKIAFMMMSTKRTQALEVIFQDTKARIDNSPWFRNRYPRSEDFKNKIEFPKNICIIPGDSLETTFEGYNLLGGVMDEIDSHKQTLVKDYAESGYATISARITSRFGRQGFLVLIGQTKTEGGFAMRRMAEFAERDDAYAVKMAIWESLDAENFSGEAFYFDTLRSKIVPAHVFVADGMSESPTMIKVPIEYLQQFTIDADKALRDLAGIPRKVTDPFIRNTDRMFSAVERYEQSHPWIPQPWVDGKLFTGFRCDDGLPRLGHIDLAYSAKTGDAAALAIGHIKNYIETDEGVKPYIVIDVVCRLVPPSGRQLELAEVRDTLYTLVQRGFRVRRVTLDGFQSTDTMQMLRKRHISSDLLSVDRQLLPYSDLRDAIYEERIEFPHVMGRAKRTDTGEVDVLVKELSELGYDPSGTKVDHPPGGTKDCADAVAGVVHNLMLRARRGGGREGPTMSGTKMSTTFGHTNMAVNPPGMPIPTFPVPGMNVYPTSH